MVAGANAAEHAHVLLSYKLASRGSGHVCEPNCYLKVLISLVITHEGAAQRLIPAQGPMDQPVQLHAHGTLPCHGGMQMPAAMCCKGHTEWLQEENPVIHSHTFRHYQMRAPQGQRCFSCMLLLVAPLASLRLAVVADCTTAVCQAQDQKFWLPTTSQC